MRVFVRQEEDERRKMRVEDEKEGEGKEGEVR